MASTALAGAEQKPMFVVFAFLGRGGDGGGPVCVCVCVCVYVVFAWCCVL